MPDSLLGGIVINEILVDPNGSINFDTDGNGTAASTDEYIELYNTSGSAIDISGLELWDAGVGQWFTFPPGSILAEGAHAMVLSGVQSGGSLPTGDPGDLFFDAGRGSPLINNGGDNVTLYDPANDEFVQATFNGDTLDDPAAGAAGYSGFSGTATRSGSGEDFGNDTDGESLQRTGDGADVFGSDAPTPGTTNICFADGTHLLTEQGARRVEHLRKGDRVVTREGVSAPIVWIHSKTWSASEMQSNPKIRPVCIAQGALGPGLPERDLFVSQQHRVLVSGTIAKRMFGTPEVLVPAKALLALAGVRLSTPKRAVTYFHMMFQDHEIVLSEGLCTESLYLGPEALASIPGPALSEALELLGLSHAQVQAGAYIPARPMAPMKQARNLIRRHRKNNKPIYA